MTRWTSWLFAILALALFLATAAPGIGTEDSGELACGARLLAMVHAPGYPLYLLLGRLAAALSSEPGRGLVLLSVFAAAAAVGLLHTIAKRELGEPAAAVAAISLTFCRGLWSSATQVEVYTLSALLLTALFGALLLFRNRPGSGKARRLVAFTIGLTLAHHVGLVILLPVIALFLLYTIVASREPVAAGDWMRASGYAIAGIALYGALMLLSTRRGIAVIWWTPITTVPQLLNVMSGAGFRNLLFAVPPDQASRNLMLFPAMLVLWFPLLSIPLALLGLLDSLRRDRPWTLMLLAIVMITIIHAANYDVLDPDRFLLPAIVPFAWLAGAGFRKLAEMRAIPMRPQAGLVSILLISALAGRISEGGILAAKFDSVPADVARAVLASHASRPGTQIIWTDWRFYPTLRYFQLVDGMGSNVYLDFDSTSTTPGSRHEEGRTWTMRASPELGRQYALVMEDLHWSVNRNRLTLSDPDTAVRSIGPPLARIGGLEILEVKRPDAARAGTLIPVELLIARDTGPAADTVAGILVLTRRSFPRMQTPFSILHWNTPPSALEPANIYREPVQTIIPSAHAGETDDSFALELRLSTATESKTIPLGRIRLRE